MRCDFRPGPAIPFFVDFLDKSMKELIERWKSDKGQELSSRVLNGILQGDSLEHLGLDKYEGRVDIRGIQFPRFLDIPRTVFKDGAFVDTDCSFANFQGSAWQRWRFDNVLFVSAKMDEVRFSECEFAAVSFAKASLHYAVMNATLGTGHGFFRNTSFMNSDLRSTIYTNTVFESSAFIDCKLKKVDFQGARFKDCKFKGLLESVQFHGVPIETFGAPAFPNKMHGVDFSEAILSDCVFVDGVDLSGCLMPKDGAHLVIRNNKNAIFSEARQEIENTWADNDIKKGALSMIDGVYMTRRTADQPIEVIYKPLFEKIGQHQFTSLIEKLMKKYQ